jgi:hypothetical protein
MAKFDVDLSDGRTIEIEAESLSDAIARQGQINNIIAQGKRDVDAANAPEQVGTIKAFMLGAGRETDKLLSGVQDLLASPEDQARIAQEQQYNDQAFANVEQQHPIASAVGGVLPYMAAPTAGFLPSLGMAAATGAARYGDTEERATNAALDTALTALPFGLGRARKAWDAVGDATGDMATRARDVGYQLTPGEMFDSRSLRTLEGGIQSMPMLGNPMHRVASANQDLINRTAGEAVGIPSPGKGFKMTDDVVGDTADNIGDVFKSLKGADDLIAGDEFVGRLADIEGSSVSRLFSDPDLGSAVNKVFDKLDDIGGMKAVDYQDMSSELKKKIGQAWKERSPDAMFAESLSDIVDALDELAENQMSGNALNELKRARAKWRSLRALEDSRAIHESGNISGKLLGNYLRRTDKGGYLRGGNKSDLYEVARMSKAFPGMPDSGTAGRSFLQHAAQNPVKGAIGALSSPIISGAANAYMYGLPAAARAVGAGARGAPSMVNPAMAGRAAGALINPDDDLEGLLPSYLRSR